MKKLKLALYSLTLLPLMACNKNDNAQKEQAGSEFCTKSRELNAEFENKKGKLLYIEKNDKYAILHTPDSATIYYVLCEKPSNIAVNDKVVFSGKSYKFNNTEGFKANIAGMKFYFFEMTNLNMKN